MGTPKGELRRGFGLSTSTYVVIASMVGTGILVSPGSVYGAGQEHYLRVALAPTVAECREATEAWPDL